MKILACPECGNTDVQYEGTYHEMVNDQHCGDHDCNCYSEFSEDDLIVDIMDIHTGVMYFRDTWLQDEEPIDPEWDRLEALYDESPMEALEELGLDLDCYDPDEDLADRVMEWSSSTLLYGDWRQHEGTNLWEPDPDGPLGYSAIDSPDTGYVQVVRSTHMLFCRPCSPCYPDQGDLDTLAEQPYGWWAYSLPPDLLQDSWENISLVVPVKTE